jgi:hypothetical protein
VRVEKREKGVVTVFAIDWGYVFTNIQVRIHHTSLSL